MYRLYKPQKYLPVKSSPIYAVKYISIKGTSIIIDEKKP